ncbi:uncharacterized protein (DUF1501 family) [Micromonospora violae]|uniref:Uncharacterized protein (DUF1501 family) n=1 Tax=Micromonospora violae TaxID=1278207 RepID=A0A4V2FQ76_9ACTN|nr:DUF1501 domain-containing protein [Micromonospora violae]RZT82930.1 uncharacterized protein (DUF1501 family) [Micromonospora violae]
MDAVTRRRFLLASGVVGGSALVAGAAKLSLGGLLHTAGEASAREDHRKTPKLVIVTLYGGNDGLNTVIPYASRAYYAARPELAYEPERVLRLDDALGLNPMLKGLSSLWGEQRLAVVLGAGYPKPDRSHFRSMDIWQSASPSGPTSSGWVGRWLDGTKAAPEAAVSFEPMLPPLLAGETRTGACVSIGGLKLPTGITPDMIGVLGRREPNESELQARAADAYANLININQLIRDAEAASAAPEVTVQPESPATSTGGSNVLSAQLLRVAQCVEAGVPTRVYSVSLGGFDTHASERIGHEFLLRQLDQALTSFAGRLSRTEAGRQVTTVVYSEFGRRVRANASDGTDHGTAGPVLVLGSQVAGGLYGEQPSLTDLDDGDLKATTDFRDVVGTLLAEVLQADPARYIGGGYEPKMLPFLARD